MPLHPMGGYILVPPGSHPPPLSPGLVIIDPVHPMAVNPLLHNIYNFEDPYVALMNAQSLGLANILGMAPARQTMLPGGTTHIREFDAVSFSTQPVRVMVLAIVSQQATVKVLVVLNLYRWAEFIGPCLQLISGISLSGAPPVPAHLQAVVDERHRDQIEFRVVTNNNQAFPLTALPTVYGNLTIINIDESIKAGNVSGTGIVIGRHSTATVTKGD
jgi:hypothetical protein